MCLNQQLHQASLTVFSGKEERRASLRVGEIDVCVGGEEQLDNLDSGLGLVRRRADLVQSRLALIVYQAHIGLVHEQDLDRLHSGPAACTSQGRHSTLA